MEWHDVCRDRPGDEVAGLSGGTGKKEDDTKLELEDWVEDEMVLSRRAGGRGQSSVSRKVCGRLMTTGNKISREFFCLSVELNQRALDELAILRIPEN
jgi:hypothetical protein